MPRATPLNPFAVLVAITVAAATLNAGQQPSAEFQLEETTIARIHAALKASRITCRGLVEQYVKRIEAYDKAGPAINAIVLVSPTALAEADDLDRRARQGGFVGLLHCAWDEEGLIALAYSYEQATRHRRGAPSVEGR